MAREPYNPARLRPESLIALLRDDADAGFDPLYDDNPEPPENTAAGEAAQMLEEWHDALTQIAAGSPNAQQVAQDALKIDAPRKAWGTPEDTIRNLLKPRSE